MLVNGKNVSLIEYLSFRYNKTLNEIVDSPQGDNQEEVDKASALLKQAQQLCQEVQNQLAEEKVALEKQRQQESSSKKQQEALKAAEEEVIILVRQVTRSHFFVGEEGRGRPTSRRR